MQCVNINHPDFKNLVKMTGLTPLEVRARVADYVEKFGEFPTVDYFLERSTTEKALVKEFNLTKRGDHYTNDTNRTIDIPSINNKYRDVEIQEVEYPVLGKRFVIKPKALLNRNLQHSENNLLPSIDNNTQEIFPIYYDNQYKYYIYQYNNKVYRTTCKVANIRTLINYPSYASIDEAKNDLTSLPFIGNTYNIISNIRQNIGRLNYNQEITVESNDLLPASIVINRNVPYVEFTYDETIQEPYNNINGTILINPKFIENSSDFDRFIMKSQGLDDSFIEWAISNPDNLKFDVIQTGKNNYIVKKSKDSIDVSVATQLQSAREFHVKSQPTLDPVLDRMEQLYGIKFNRITTQQLMEGKFLEVIPNATDVNAFILDGQIYINMDRASIDAPIHEISHILLGSIKFTNPSLYYKIVSSVENLEDYEQRIQEFPNRARSDVNEEIFVDLFSQYYINQTDLPLDDLQKEKLEYEIKHNIDSGIFPHTSVTKGNINDIMNSSLLDIMDEFGTCINKDAIIQAFSTGTVYHRKLANLKEQLLKDGDLKEYCTKGKGSNNISYIHIPTKIK